MKKKKRGQGPKMVTATNHFIRLLVSGKSVKKADRTKGGKYLDKKEQICI